MFSKRNWEELLGNCDFVMAAEEIRDALWIQKRKAESQGEDAFYTKEWLDVLYPFLTKPSLANAIPLLELTPSLYTYFESCSPGGDFYELRRLYREVSGKAMKPNYILDPEAGKKNNDPVQHHYSERLRSVVPPPARLWLSEQCKPN